MHIVIVRYRHGPPCNCGNLTFQLSYYADLVTANEAADRALSAAEGYGFTVSELAVTTI